MKMEELFDTYFKYVEHSTESAFVYHRWSLIGLLSALIAKKVEIPLGHMTLYANLYLQLLGKSGTRKSSAISVAVKLLKTLEYERFAPKKCSKEGFLDMLLEYCTEDSKELPSLDEFALPPEPTANMLIAADEFNAFLGNNYEDFLELLSELFDMPTEYDKRLASGGNSILNPCVTILSGNTPSGFRSKFKGASLNQGILTRFILIPWHEVRGALPFPPAPCPKIRRVLTKTLKQVGARRGTVEYSDEAEALLSEIYTKWKPDTPVHMEQYAERRYTHLLTLCAIFATVESAELLVTRNLVLMANTILASNEHNMATAFKTIFESPTQGIVRDYLLNTLKGLPEGLSPKELYVALQTQGVSYADIIKSTDALILQGEIIRADTGVLILKKKRLPKNLLEFLDLRYLTEEERLQYGKQ